MGELFNFILVLQVLFCFSVEAKEVFPGVGQTYVADYGSFKARLSFHSETEMTYLITDGEGKGETETVQIQVTFLRSKLYRVSWQEISKMTVVQIEDFKKEVVYSSLTDANDHSFTSVFGSWKRLN